MFKPWVLFLTIPFLLGNAVAVEPEQARFVMEYVKAVNAKDPERLTNLIHPASLGCVTEDNRDYFEDYLARELKEAIPADYKIVGVTPIGADEPALMPDAFSYPVKPTYWIELDFKKGPYDSKRLLRQIVKVEDQWLMVLPCPKPETVRKYRENKRAEERMKERARVLLEDMEAPLREELLPMLKNGRKINAWKRYSAATGESLSMSKEVLSLLTESVNGQERMEEHRVDSSVQEETAPPWASALIGKSYGGLDELKSDQESKGYVLIGGFGDSWPAELKKVEFAMNGITFELANGVTQAYTGYDGYEMVLMRLHASDDKENVAIFRSAARK